MSVLSHCISNQPANGSHSTVTTTKKEILKDIESSILAFLLFCVDKTIPNDFIYSF